MSKLNDKYVETRGFTRSAKHAPSIFSAVVCHPFAANSLIQLLHEHYHKLIIYTAVLRPRIAGKRLKILKYFVFTASLAPSPTTFFEKLIIAIPFSTHKLFTSLAKLLRPFFFVKTFKQTLVGYYIEDTVIVQKRMSINLELNHYFCMWYPLIKLFWNCFAPIIMVPSGVYFERNDIIKVAMRRH